MYNEQLPYKDFYTPVRLLLKFIYLNVHIQDILMLEELNWPQNLIMACRKIDEVLIDGFVYSL